MKYQIEVPVSQCHSYTYRSTDINNAANRHLKEGSELSLEDMQELLDEVKIRFDTNPNFYLKNDYKALIDFISQLFNKHKVSNFGGPAETATIPDSFKLYIATQPGIYTNFLNSEQEVFEVTEDDFNEKIVIFNPKFDDTLYYEKVVIDISKSISTKADKVKDAVEGNLPSLNTEGNLVDSGKKVGSSTLEENPNENTLATEKAVETAIDAITILVDEDDKVLSTDSTGKILSSDIQLSYDPEDKTIKLFGKDTNQPINTINAEDLFKEAKEELTEKIEELQKNTLTSIAYEDLVYDNPFFASIPTGHAKVELFIGGYILSQCTLWWDRSTDNITFTITGPLTIGADRELDIIVGIENPVQKGDYLLSHNTVTCSKYTHNGYQIPWMYSVDTHLLSTAVEYVDQKLGDDEFGYDTQLVVIAFGDSNQNPDDVEKLYYCTFNTHAGMLWNDEMVYEDKECLTPIGKLESQDPYILCIFNIKGDVNSGFKEETVSLQPLSIIDVLPIQKIIDSNTIATEKGVENYVKEQIEELNKALLWDGNSNINNYTETGIYHFAGLRLNAQDNLPIDNAGGNSNIAFTLIVDRVNGEYNETDTTINNIPGIISQTLFLGNRQGTETKIYVRNANIQYSKANSEGVITWEAWKEQVGQTFLGLLSSYDELNRVAEIGIYTGAVVDGTSTFDVFKLEVINNYSIAGEYNSVLQTLTKLSVGGSNATQKRVGTWNGSNYEWGDWLAMAENPDWNQNDETAADYIKNRTHYELVKDYKMMYDDEYGEKIQEGKQFELQKVKTVTIDNNRYYYDESLAPEERDEYQGEVTSIPLMARRSNGGGSNLTYFSPRISINGKTIDLTWVEKTLENVYASSIITPDPPFDLILDEEIRVFYNFARQDHWLYGNNCAYGEGFTWFISDYVDGSAYSTSVGGGLSHHRLNTYFIDPEVFGPAPYNIDIYFEVEYELKKIDPKFLPNISGEILNWDGNSNINNYTETGIYHFAGYRRNTNDNLPITNSGDNANIAFTLIVDRKNGYYNETETTINDIPGIISQTLFLGNRQGSETRMYVRNGNIQYSDTDSEGVITWEAWRELMQTTYLGVLNSYDALNTTTEIGLYTGAMFNFASQVADVFKLEVINNYAVTTQVSAATGLSTPPNSVLQTITILNLYGSNATKKRIGTYNGNGYTWGEWEDCGKAATTHKRGDVVILQQRTSPDMSISTKVISWEEFKNTHQNYAYPGNRYTQGEFPIGLVVDPAKRTFLYLRQLDGSVYSKIKNSISGMENTMYSNGIENSYQIKKNVNNTLWDYSSADSIFYSGLRNQLKQFIPSYAESAMSKQIVEDAYYGEKFYERLIELNELMQGPGYYPGILTEPTDSIATNLFYCLNSTIMEEGGEFYIGNAQGDDSSVSLWNSGYMEFFGIYFND